MLPAAEGGLPSVVVGGLAGMAVAVGVAVVLAVRGRRRGAGLPVAPAAIAPMVPVTRTERWWAAGVSVGAGVSEELVFRGLLLAVAVGLGASPLLAAGLLSVVFGAVHLYQGVAGVVTTTLFGAVMAAMALSTGSLLLPVLLHVAVDLRSLLLTRPAEVPDWLRPGPGR